MFKMKIVINIMIECWRFMRFTLRYNASILTDSNMRKMQYSLMRENHVIEKGMSLRNPRLGFGQKKVIDLISHLSKYVDLYMSFDSDFLVYPLCTIRSYIRYTKEKNVDIKNIEYEFRNLCDKIESKGYHFSEEIVSAGVIMKNHETLKEEIKKPFQEFVMSRHSIRYFTDEIPARSIVEKALNTARYTPSACNRQSWHTHIYTGEIAHKLFEIQGGAHGFEHDMHMGIIVTADANAFLHYEIHQPYIDGGLYAMSLIYSLHAEGLGCVPLSFGFYMDKLKRIKKEFSIPENEILIVLLGVGYLPKVYKIAVSNRLELIKTNLFHY